MYRELTHKPVLNMTAKLKGLAAYIFDKKAVTFEKFDGWGKSYREPLELFWLTEEELELFDFHLTACAKIKEKLYQQIALIEEVGVHYVYSKIPQQ
jgi:hypothetical protein